MKLIDVGDSGEIVEHVNTGIRHAVDTIVDAIGSIVAEASTHEHVAEGDSDLAITITTVPGIEFPALHATHQLGRLDPTVIAAGDTPEHPVVLAVDSSERVNHDPSLKQVLEENAAGLIECLGHGLWHFRTTKTPQGVGLELLNPRMLGDKPALLFGVDERRITISEEQWFPAGAGSPLGWVCYVRDADRPHLATWCEPDAEAA